MPFERTPRQHQVKARLSLVRESATVRERGQWIQSRPSLVTRPGAISDAINTHVHRYGPTLALQSAFVLLPSDPSTQPASPKFRHDEIRSCQQLPRHLHSQQKCIDANFQTTISNSPTIMNIRRWPPSLTTNSTRPD